MKLLFLLIYPIMLFSVSYSPLRSPWPPFVSGDGFRAHCDHVFDEEDQSLDPRIIKPYEVLFVKTDYLSAFFSKIHPNISCKYILVTHNSDYSAPGAFASFLEEEKLVAWFGQNIDNAHSKLHPIPIGIANRMWGHGRGSVIQEVQSLAIPKNGMLYVNIAIGTYPKERELVYNLLANAPFSYCATVKPFEVYLQELASCKFVATPRGNGLDTHRLWESLYLGSYPIVKTSTLDPLYTELPVIIIQEWDQITEEFLEQKYKELNTKNFNIEKINMSYWIKLIDNHKK